MPYIKLEDKVKIKIPSFFSDKNNDPGKLNYIITQLCLDYLDNGPYNYKSLNEVIGVLESAKLEFYRRAVSVYEDAKIKENGDVY